MTLEEMASHVCLVARQENDEALAACKRIIDSRYRVIWNECLWKESVAQFNGTIAVTGSADLNNTTNMGASGFYLFPNWVDRIMAVRITGGNLPVQSTQAIIETTPDVFEQSGTPVGFQVLSPCVYMHAGSPDETLYIFTDDDADAGTSVHVELVASTGLRLVQDIAVTTTPQALGGVGVLEKFSKPVTVGTIRIDPVSLAPGEQCYDAHPRIQMLPKPTSDTAFKSLVKKRPSKLINDTDCPEIRGVDNCLMSFAMGDMLRRARQYAKAQETFTEALALLEQLKSVNVVQEASRTQLVPDVSGFGYEEDFLGSKW